MPFSGTSSSPKQSQYVTIITLTARNINSSMRPSQFPLHAPLELRKIGRLEDWKAGELPIFHSSILPTPAVSGCRCGVAAGVNIRHNQPWSKQKDNVQEARAGIRVSRKMTTAQAKGFGPIEDSLARILILGSIPGEASLAAGEYYAHPRNAFWRIMGRLFDFDPGGSYKSRSAALRSAGIALWDVLRACRRAVLGACRGGRE